MRKSIGIILLIVLAATFVNDVGRFAKASYDINNVAVETADRLSSQRDRTRNQNATMAAEYAAARGTTVYLYDQDKNTYHAWFQAPLEGTWILGTVMSYYGGGLLTDPYYVKSEAEGSFYR